MSSRLDQYEDAAVRCDDDGVTIARYYPWGAKFLPYSEIRGVTELPLTGRSLRMTRARSSESLPCT